MDFQPKYLKYKIHFYLLILRDMVSVFYFLPIVGNDALCKRWYASLWSMADLEEISGTNRIFWSIGIQWCR